MILLISVLIRSVDRILKGKDLLTREGWGAVGGRLKGYQTKNQKQVKPFVLAKDRWIKQGGKPSGTLKVGRYNPVVGIEEWAQTKSHKPWIKDESKTNNIKYSQQLYEVQMKFSRSQPATKRNIFYKKRIKILLKFCEIIKCTLFFLVMSQSWIKFNFT